LKDFRTLSASVPALDALARMAPAASARKRRIQVLEAVRSAEETRQYARHRKSYMHEAVVTAFAHGVLRAVRCHLAGVRWQARREQVLARVTATMDASERP
jgi:DNA topoisomerase-1